MNAGVREAAAAFKLPADHAAVWEPRAGALNPERCVQAHLDLAARHGAALHFGEAASPWRPDGDGVVVETPSDTYQADRCILSAGAWTTAFTTTLGLPLRVTRQTVFWFRPARPASLTPERCPIYVWHLPDETTIYGFPDFGDGAKVGIHNPIDATDPNAVDRKVGAAEISRMQTLMHEYLPAAAGGFLRAEVCLYTNTPDGHFLLDFHPHHRQVVIASPYSGHGFKFSATIGAVLADLVMTGASRFDLGLFRLDRLLSPLG